MISEAVRITFATLTHWEIYLAGLVYMVIILIPMMFMYLFGSTGERGGAIRMTSMVMVPVFQAIGTLVFVFSIAQIALGFSDNATWRMPFHIALESPGQFLKLSFFMALISIAFAILPVIGRITSLQTLILSGFALIMMLSINDAGHHEPLYDNLEWIPNFLFIIGIVVAGAIFSGIGMALTDTLPKLLSKITGRNVDKIGAMIVLPIASTLGFVPFFIYAAWIGGQII